MGALLGLILALLPVHVAADAHAGVQQLHLRARGSMEGKTAEHTAEVLYLWESVGKITGPVEDQQLAATITDLPPILLETPETLTLQSGKPARLKVRVKRFDGGKTSLTIEPDPVLEGVKFDGNVLEPGSSQLELRVSAGGPVKATSFRLRTGAALSPPIELKSEPAEESSR